MDGIATKFSCELAVKEKGVSMGCDADEFLFLLPMSHTPQPQAPKDTTIQHSIFKFLHVVI
jgi:hypothetical protein